MKKLKSFFKNNSKKTKRALCVLLTLFVAFSIVTVWGNITLSVERISTDSDKLNIEGGFKIAHISDYHNTKNKFLTDAILSSLTEEKPDVIFVTGDLVDCRKTDIEKGLAFVSEIIEIAPVYYVTGNHECNISINSQTDFDNMISDMEDMGVTVLRGENAEIKLENGEKINVFGIDDPYFHCSSMLEVTGTTNELCSELEIEEGYNVLLAHHPEQLDVYSLYGFDVVFSGHAHGGQGRLFGFGLIAPDQGFFPEYTSGLYVNGKTYLVVSRGIGNSIAPVRIFDRSHLIYMKIR